MNNLKVFNTPFETGVRCIVILDEFKMPLDLQQLIYFDYFTLHYGDVDNNRESLHPSNPFHVTEMIIRREIIQKGLNLICRKGLVNIQYSNKGIEYETNGISNNFLSYFESEYFSKLKFNANLVANRFKSYSEKTIKNYIDSNLDKWKGEFEQETLFRGDRVE